METVLVLGTDPGLVGVFNATPSSVCYTSYLIVSSKRLIIFIYKVIFHWRIICVECSFDLHHWFIGWSSKDGIDVRVRGSIDDIVYVFVYLFDWLWVDMPLVDKKVMTTANVV